MPSPGLKPAAAKVARGFESHPIRFSCCFSIKRTRAVFVEGGRTPMSHPLPYVDGMPGKREPARAFTQSASLELSASVEGKFRQKLGDLDGAVSSAALVGLYRLAGCGSTACSIAWMRSRERTSLKTVGFRAWKKSRRTFSTAS